MTVITAREQEEVDRVAAHKAALDAISEHPEFGQTETVDELTRRLVYLTRYPQRDWQEFYSQAANVLCAEIGRTVVLIAAARKRDAEP